MRRFAVALVGLALVATAPMARADDVPAFTPKKDDRWRDKQQPGKPLRTINRKKLVGKKPAPIVSMWNSWTHEWVAIDRSAKSMLDAAVDRFLRCHFTNEPADMDSRLSGVLLEAARHFGVDRINIVSGFRSPKYNLSLRKKGRGVARDSAHTKGHAVDFWLPGVTTQQLYDWALGHQIGGVGFYAQSGFVHVDSGKKRTWNGE